MFKTLLNKLTQHKKKKQSKLNYKNTNFISSHSGDHLHILFWNVENLFDDVNDPEWFDDSINSYWDSDLYHLKVKHLCEILKPWALQKTVFCFAEIENKAVLEKLRLSLPNPDDYQVIYHHNNFTRIKQGILSPIKVESSVALDYARGLRPILRADLIWSDTKLTLFVNHWKSRRGGKGVTQRRRMESANFLSKEIEKIRKKDKEAEVLVVGDFNDEPHDTSIRKGLKATSVKEDVGINKNTLYNFMGSNSGFRGTHYHEGEWQTFDQVIVSPGLLDDKDLYVKECKILSDERLIYKGHRPNRFGGPNIHNSSRGYSDHLPILVTLAKHTS